MKQTTTTLLLTATVSLFVISCGGGGGGGGTESTDTTTTAPVTNPVTPAPTTPTTPTTPAKVASIHTPETAPISEVRGVTTIKAPGDEIVINEEDRVFVNGVDVTDTDKIARGFSTSDYGYSYYLAYQGKNGPSIIYVPIDGGIPTEDIQSEIEAPDGTFPDLMAPALDGVTSFEDIEYQYTYSNLDGTWKTVTGDDGEITYDAAKSGWMALFDNDKVKLDGTYNGTDVKGVATWNGISGQFKGYDAYGKLAVPSAGGIATTTIHETDGAFGGTNGTQVFSGVWGLTEYLADDPSE